MKAKGNRYRVIVCRRRTLKSRMRFQGGEQKNINLITVSQRFHFRVCCRISSRQVESDGSGRISQKKGAAYYARRKKTVPLSPYKHTEGLKESSTKKERFFSSSYFNSLFTSTPMHERIHNRSELLKYLVRVSQKESP